MNFCNIKVWIFSESQSSKRVWASIWVHFSTLYTLELKSWVLASNKISVSTFQIKDPRSWALYTINVPSLRSWVLPLSSWVSGINSEIGFKAPWISGATFQILDLRFRVPPLRWVQDLESLYPSKVPGIECHFMDMPKQLTVFFIAFHLPQFRVTSGSY